MTRFASIAAPRFQSRGLPARCLLLALGALLLLASAGFAQSDPDEPLPLKKPPAKAAIQPESDDAPPTAPPAGRTPPKPEKPLDQELKRVLQPDAPDDEDAAVEQLERAIRSMREAQQRIDAQDAGQQTRALQEQIVRDLEQLIEAVRKLENQPPPPPSSDAQQQQQKKKKLQLQQQARLDPQNSEPQGKQPQPTPAEAPGSQRRNDDEPARESTDQAGPARQVDPDLARQRNVVKDVWGHLPPQLREELLNVYSEKYLPKYEEQVRRYYEALAEKNRQRTPRP